MARSNPLLQLVPRKQRKIAALIILLLTAVIYFGQQHGWFGSVKQAAEVNQPGLYTVVNYDDGDTIVIDPRKSVQCYGPEASAFTKQLISDAGGKVRLSSDPQSTNRDRYNRLLRYIYLPDGRLVQDELLKTGHAFYYPYFPFTKSDRFASEQATAKQANIGLWTHCHPTPTDGGGYTSNPL
jgi:hypothetical protein